MRFELRMIDSLNEAKEMYKTGEMDVDTYKAVIKSRQRSISKAHNKELELADEWKGVPAGTDALERAEILKPYLPENFISGIQA